MAINRTPRDGTKGVELASRHGRAPQMLPVPARDIQELLEAAGRADRVGDGPHGEGVAPGCGYMYTSLNIDLCLMSSFNHRYFLSVSEG
jgi:hypothetical protein